MEETEELIKYIKELGGQKVPVSYMFLIPLLNVIWRFIAGKRYDIHDQTLQGFASKIINVFENGTATNMLLFLPFLRHIPGHTKNEFLKLKNSHDSMKEFIGNEFDEHLKTYQEGHDRDLMDAFITEMHKNENSKERSKKFTKGVIVGMACDFFNAAVDAGNHTLAWALLYMATWQDIQHKVQQEIDTVIGRDRIPTYPDRNRLRYTEAVIMEVLRYSSVAPLSVPHVSVAPTKVLGYDIPKDAFVMESIWGVHFDPELWGDPEVFRPERFINENGELIRPEYLIPFGTGFRMCMGEPLGKMEMFLMFTGLMHQFAVSYVSGEDRPSFKVVLGLNSRHEDFSLNFRVR